MFDWNLYNGGLKWMKDRTIYITVHGSHAYNTNIATSDIDYRGIVIPPKEYFYGINDRFENSVQKDPDLSIFDIRKFFILAIENNPNVLELLFTDPEHHLLVTPAFEKIYNNRELFLSKKAKYSLSGYAYSQFKRIKLHRQYLLNPPKCQPTREQFGLINRTLIPKDQLAAAQAAIQKRLDEWSWKDLEHVEPATRQALKNLFVERVLELTQWKDIELEEKTWSAAVNSLGFSTNFIEYLDKERLYNNRKREWNQYQIWKKERNPARAELEAKYLMDTKHAGHLVRLTRTCRDLLTTGKYIVKRPDAEELIAIRHGAWTYEQLEEWFDKQQKELDELYETSTIPHQPDRVKLNDICMEIIEESL